MGEAFARQLAERGLDLVLVARSTAECGAEVLGERGEDCGGQSLGLYPRQDKEACVVDHGR